MNIVRDKKRSKVTGCKDIGGRRFEFAAKIQSLEGTVP